MKLPRIKKPEKKKAEKKVAPFNPKWELFCQYYIKNEELRRNGTHSYAEAYNYKLDELDRHNAIYEQIELENGQVREGKLLEPSSYTKAEHVCAVEASRLLRNPEIQKRMIVLLNEMLTDQIVDGELAKVILQDVERPAKVAAIKEYNALKARVIKKMELTGKDGEPLFTDEHTTKANKAIGAYLGRNPR